MYPKIYIYEFAGLSNVLSNLNRQIKAIPGKTRRGLATAGLIVKAESMRMTPVDSGDLINSAYTDPYDTFSGPGVEIGYTAEYAPHVHEHDVHYRKPGSQWKFLETALFQSADRVFEVIRDTAKL
jgi:hypothetical protein